MLQTSLVPGIFPPSFGSFVQTSGLNLHRNSDPVNNVQSAFISLYVWCCSFASALLGLLWYMYRTQYYPSSMRQTDYLSLQLHVHMMVHACCTFCCADVTCCTRDNWSGIAEPCSTLVFAQEEQMGGESCCELSEAIK